MEDTDATSPSDKRANYPRTCPFPITSYFDDVNSLRANGPRQCSFCVLIPISAPNPNSPPSENRVDAFQNTVAESTARRNRRAFASFSVTMASVFFVEYRAAGIQIYCLL